MIIKKKAGAIFWTALALLAMFPGRGGSAEGNSIPAEWAGVWKLRKDLGAPGISALTNQEVRGLLGQKIRISKDAVFIPREHCRRPVFKVSTHTPSDFLAEFNVTGAQFPLIGKTMEVFDIVCEGSVTYRLARLANGCAFFPRDGHFFQLEKIDNRVHLATRVMPTCLVKLAR